VYYRIFAYAILLPFMIYRLAKYELPAPLSMTPAIFLAPSSLVVVGYLNVTANPEFGGTFYSWIVYAAFAVVMISLIYIIIRLPKWLSKPFNLGFAALTFPTAIGLVATQRVFNFLLNNGFETAGEFFRQVFGIQLWLTTAIMSYVAFGFLKMLFSKAK